MDQSGETILRLRSEVAELRAEVEVLRCKIAARDCVIGGREKQLADANLQLRAMVEERDLYSDVVDAAESWLRHHCKGALDEAEANKALRYQVERLGPKVEGKRKDVCLHHHQGKPCPYDIPEPE